VPYLSASAVVIHYEEALYQVYAPLNVIKLILSRKIWTSRQWEKLSEKRQTLHASCSKAEPKIFTPSQTPSQGRGMDQSLISWRWSLPLPTNPVWWGSMHTISSYRGNRRSHTQKQTQTGPITIHCTAASA